MKVASVLWWYKIVICSQGGAQIIISSTNISLFFSVFIYGQVIENNITMYSTSSSECCACAQIQTQYLRHRIRQIKWILRKSQTIRPGRSHKICLLAVLTYRLARSANYGIAKFANKPRVSIYSTSSDACLNTIKGRFVGFLPTDVI